MAGKLYGVGVGPGDPELLTLKALRLVKEAEVIALPGQVPEDTVAFKIVEGAYPELGKKELLAVPFPMSKDPEVLKSYHDAGADKVKAVLDQGKDVVFLTLGDPTVYSTYLYIHHRLVAQGYETEIVCGITSFCAVSARLNTGLVEKAEPLHVIPASYQIEDAAEAFRYQGPYEGRKENEGCEGGASFPGGRGHDDRKLRNAGRKDLPDRGGDP